MILATSGDLRLTDDGRVYLDIENGADDRLLGNIATAAFRLDRKHRRDWRELQAAWADDQGRSILIRLCEGTSLMSTTTQTMLALNLETANRHPGDTAALFAVAESIVDRLIDLERAVGQLRGEPSEADREEAKGECPPDAPTDAEWRQYLLSSTVDVWSAEDLDALHDELAECA